MEFKNGIIIDEEGNFHIIKPRYKLFDLGLPGIQEAPEIILTKEEAEARGLSIPKVKGWRRLLPRKGGYYTKIEGVEVFITIKEKP